MPDTTIAPLLLPWFEQHGRKNLPWQRDKDDSGYRVWLSEVMLQQTQVSTVIPYFERFLQRYPDFTALARADIDEVLSLWAGLGYYARARNLHRCAREVVEQHHARLPREMQKLIALPGIGRSTAGAILSLAFGEQAAILDGNVKRVLSRVFRVQGWAGQSSVLKSLWQLAEQQTPRTATADYNQAMMDLGATLCKRRAPLCQECPLREMCQSYRFAEQHLYPHPKPGKRRPLRHTWMLIHRSLDRVLLERRPPSGIWGGLWSLPELESLDQLPHWQLQLFGQHSDELIRLDIVEKSLRHRFTHFDLDISTVLIDTPASAATCSGVEKSAGMNWLPLSRLEDFGIPAPVMKLLSAIRFQD